MQIRIINKKLLIVIKIRQIKHQLMMDLMTSRLLNQIIQKFRYILYKLYIYIILIYLFNKYKK